MKASCSLDHFRRPGENAICLLNHGLNVANMPTNFFIVRYELKIVSKGFDHAQRLSKIVCKVIYGESLRAGN